MINEGLTLDFSNFAATSTIGFFSRPPRPASMFVSVKNEHFLKLTLMVHYLRLHCSISFQI